MSSIALAPADGLATTDLGRVDGDYDGDHDSDGAAAFPSYNGDVVERARRRRARPSRPPLPPLAPPLAPPPASPYRGGAGAGGSRARRPGCRRGRAGPPAGAGRRAAPLYMVVRRPHPPPTAPGPGPGPGATIEADGRAGRGARTVAHGYVRDGCLQERARLRAPRRRRDVEVALLKAGAGSRRRLATAGVFRATPSSASAAASPPVTNNTEKPRALQPAWRLPAAAAAANMVRSRRRRRRRLLPPRRSPRPRRRPRRRRCRRTWRHRRSPSRRRASSCRASPCSPWGWKAALVDLGDGPRARPGHAPHRGPRGRRRGERRGSRSRRSPRCSLRPRRLTPEQVRAASRPRRRPGAAAAAAAGAAAVVAAGSATAAGWRWAGSPGGNNRPCSGSYTTGNRSRSNSAVVMSSPFPAPLRSSSRSSSTALNDGGSDDNDVEDDEDDGEGALATSPALSPAAAAAAAAPTANSGMDDDDLPAPGRALRRSRRRAAACGDDQRLRSRRGAPADTWDWGPESPRPCRRRRRLGQRRGGASGERQGDNVGEIKKRRTFPRPATLTRHGRGSGRAAERRRRRRRRRSPPAPADAPSEEADDGRRVYGDGSNDRGADERRRYVSVGRTLPPTTIEAPQRRQQRPSRGAGGRGHRRRPADGERHVRREFGRLGLDLRRRRSTRRRCRHSRAGSSSDDRVVVATAGQQRSARASGKRPLDQR